MCHYETFIVGRQLFCDDTITFWTTMKIVVRKSRARMVTPPGECRQRSVEWFKKRKTGSKVR